MKQLKTMVVITVFVLLCAGAYAQNMSSKGISTLLTQQKAWQVKQLPNNSVLRQFELKTVAGNQYYTGSEEYVDFHKPFKQPAFPSIKMPAAAQSEPAFATAAVSSTASSSKTNAHQLSPFLGDVTLPITPQALAATQWKY
jgi:hypothetical protein